MTRGRAVEYVHSLSKFAQGLYKQQAGIPSRAPFSYLAKRSAQARFGFSTKEFKQFNLSCKKRARDLTRINME